MCQFKKNILHLSTAVSWRGGERQISFLMEQNQNEDYRQFLYCPVGSALGRLARSQSWNYRTYLKSSPFNPISAWRLTTFCRNKQIKLIHVHDANAHTLALCANVFFRLNLPVVVSRRVDFPLSKSLWSNWKYNHHSIKKIVCVSGFIKDLIAPKIRDKEKITVIYSGVNLDQVESYGTEGSLREQLNCPEEIPIIAHIGAIAPHKDLPTFLAVAEITLLTTDCLFVIIGADGGEEEKMRFLVKEKKLINKVLFLGFRDDIKNILKDISILLVTSKTEGLNTSILDAFVAGVPVVATAAGGIEELVRHEFTGFTSKVGDADSLSKQLIRVLSDKTERQNIIINAQEMARNFSKEKMTRQVLNLYGEILN
jgi:glycosyltransferase involved in cell wall biosynthesis